MVSCKCYTSFALFDVMSFFSRAIDVDHCIQILLNGLIAFSNGALKFRGEI